MKNTYTLNIYTDGACSGNPGNGGTGHVIVMDGVNCLESNNEGYIRTTNNRMEILAVVKGLKSAKRYIDTTLLGDLHKDRDIDIKINVYSDSQLVINTMTQGWAKKSNKDLWKQLDAALARFETHGIKCTFNKVKGHAFDRWNNLADELAVKASQNPILHDEVYENIWWLTPSVRPCVEPVPKPENNIADELAVHGRENFCNQVDEVYEKIAGKADEESLLAEPKVKEIRLLGYDTPERRKVEVLLSNGTTVTIIPCHGGFEQTGCTRAESALTVDIARRFVGYLNGKSL